MASVMLYSGGLDSFVMKEFYPTNTYLFFQTGTEDNLREEDNVRSIIPSSQLMIRRLDLSQFELDNKIVPYRNHIMVMLASWFGTDIYIGCTLGDTTKDKDYVFQAQIEGTLNYFSLDSNKVNPDGYPYHLHMPLKQLSKTQIVQKYLDSGASIDLLRKHSRSCYHGMDGECGRCRSCLRKYVALTMNGINCNEWFETNPFTLLHSFLQECRSKNRDKQELEEIERCLI